MSSEASESTTEAAKGISASVERLEKLFDKLYADTFSMMRDTVSDMRKHIWPTEEGEPEKEKASEEVETKADEKINELKAVMEKQIAEVLQQQRIADDKVSAVRAEMRHLIDRAINRSREVETEAREETLRERIVQRIRHLRRTRPLVTASDIVEGLDRTFPASRVISELNRMAAEGIIRTNADEIGPRTEIKISGALSPIRTLARPTGETD